MDGVVPSGEPIEIIRTLNHVYYLQTICYGVYMHVISRPVFIEAQAKYPNDAEALDRLYKALCGDTFDTPDQMRVERYPSLDNFRYKAHWYVIDVGGNNLRLIADIRFPPFHHCLYVKAILTHAEYDKLCKRASKKGWNGEI